MKNYVSKGLFLSVILFLATSIVSVATTFITSSNDGYVNFRKEPSSSSRVIKTFGNGVKLESIGKSGNWYHLKYYDSKNNIVQSGYIHESQLRRANSSNSGNISYYTSSKDGYVNVRSKATTNSTILRELSNGVKLTILDKQGEWYYVSYGSGKGYIHSSQIRKSSK